MSHPVNDTLKEDIMEEVTSMSVDEFMNAIQEYNISGLTILDEMVDNLIQAKFEQRSI